MNAATETLFAQSLDEAIRNAMCVGPLSELAERFHNEIRDYLNHQIAHFLGKKPMMDPLTRHEWDLKYVLLMEFVRHVVDKPDTTL